MPISNVLHYRESVAIQSQRGARECTGEPLEGSKSKAVLEKKKKENNNKTAIIDVRDKLPACCFAYTEMNEWFGLERS